MLWVRAVLWVSPGLMLPKAAKLSREKVPLRLCRLRQGEILAAAAA